ncbi:hypothetical protein [Pedobacter cryophilus]|uniref:Outer membrane protein beta-barrel domain-containing protein n=1 Tax=Pedobacter cryophilus TaxID=2571271 RepID=A0A4U1BV82_9SPHI|nr:hypothetical protein [Pedobacter cryophilus]TKB96699.1 hypothetical protein FA046_11455 [Pedobacter cryophilus]
MKSLISTIYLLIACSLISYAQENQKTPTKLRFFNRTELSYTFGINEPFLGDKPNALHVKSVFGFTLPKVGFGLGLENASFKSTNTNGGANFNTIAFTGNIHFLAKPIEEDGINFFIKGGAGYAPRIFRGYDKGFTYEAATGLIITTKKGSRYFLQGIYHYQEVNDFILSNGKLQIKSVGAGVGTWF